MTVLEEKFGKRAINIQVDSRDYDTIEAHAKADQRSVAAYVRAVVLRTVTAAPKEQKRKRT